MFAAAALDGNWIRGGARKSIGSCGCVTIWGSGGTTDRRDAVVATVEGRVGGGGCARGLRRIIN